MSMDLPNMIELITNPAVWASFLSLCVLEIVLGVDNVLFISVTASRLPESQRRNARIMGLIIGLFLRVALLFSISWITTLTKPVIEILNLKISWRDLILIAGGVFLVMKACSEVYKEMEIPKPFYKQGSARFKNVIIQIAIIDVVFSLDSVITAVGIAEHISVMVAAIIVAIIVMIIAAEAVSSFIEQHPSAKMLGLAFLVLVGVLLIADGFHQHLDRRFIYAAMLFAFIVETLNIVRKRRSRVQKN